MADELSIEDPPADVAAEVAALAQALDADEGGIPAKMLDRNLLVATWNLRAFGDLTKSWRAGEKDSPKRDFRDVRFVAEIVSRFDVIAIQEVRGNLRALRHLLKVLGPTWGFTLTDVTKGRLGNSERLAFLFDTRRVRPSGLACELVEPIEAAENVAEGALDRQFARTPYCVSFLSGDKTLILVTLHVLFGQETDRVKELAAIAQWLADWAEQEDEWNHNVIALGDFNINGRENDPLFDAFISTGLAPADGLNEVPRTIFDTPEKTSFYDQVAWFRTGKRPLLTLRQQRAGSFDFVQHLYPGMEKVPLSWKISDHYPLWVEFSVR